MLKCYEFCLRFPTHTDKICLNKTVVLFKQYVNYKSQTEFFQAKNAKKCCFFHSSVKNNQNLVIITLNKDNSNLLEKTTVFFKQ